jgi:formate hydrogenlyase subunit 6/NADH:ubiquinone oxidoreductase subunit I
MSRIKAVFGLFLNLFRKPVTVDESYGFLPDTYRGLPRRDADRCTGCGACYERCSSGATKMTDIDDRRTVSVDGYNCIYCGRCADVCPEKALTLNFEGKEAPKDDQELLARIDLNRYAGEDAPHEDTTLALQRCSVCGEIMPVTEKFLEVIRQRTLDNLQPDTARVIDKDMEKFLTACISCRQKNSLIWGTHPRKWVGK